jgi:hypothetical protein
VQAGPEVLVVKEGSKVAQAAPAAIQNSEWTWRPITTLTMLKVRDRSFIRILVTCLLVGGGGGQGGRGTRGGQGGQAGIVDA